MQEEKISKGLDTFLSYLRETEETYRMAEAIRVEMDAAQQDLLHALELGQYDSRDRARLALKLREVRRERRKAKNTLEQTGPVVSWLEQNKGTVKALERLLGEVRKLERYAETRVYTPRTQVLEETVKETQV